MGRKLAYILLVVGILVAPLCYAADWYVSATAGGGGVGSEADPFTIAEGVTKADYADGDICWIKAGTYTIAAQLVVADNYVTFAGYNTTIGDLNEVWGEGSGATAKPVIDTGGLAADMWFMNKQSVVANIVLDGTNCTRSGFSGNSTQAGIHNCVAKNLTTANEYGIKNFQYVSFCIAHDCAYGIRGAISYGSLAYDCATGGFTSSYALVNSVAYSNTGYGAIASVGIVINCVFDSNSGDGLDMTTSIAINCISQNNGGYAYDSQADPNKAMALYSCQSYNNTSGRTRAVSFDINPVTTEVTFTNKAAYDFTLSNTNAYGLGAYLGVIDNTSSTLDLGAIQKSAGTGSVAVAPTDVTGQQLEAIGGGCLRFTWTDVGDETAYKIYVREGASHAWNATYVEAILPSGTTEYIFRTDYDGAMFNGSDDVYVGVRALATDYSTEDTNTVILNVVPKGVDTYLNMDDIVAIGR